MVDFFPALYEDELLYSIIARYHYYSGNISPKDTASELFGNFEINRSILFASNLELLAQNLTKFNKYNSEYFIGGHTIYPLVDLFLPESRQVNIISEIKNSNGKNMVCKLKILYKYFETKLKYCPICAQEDFNRNKESYFHRTHQVYGVHVCPKHGCLLFEYPVNFIKVRRNYFERFDINKVNLQEEYEQNHYFNYHFLTWIPAIS